MKKRVQAGVMAAMVGLLAVLTAFNVTVAPEDEFAAIVKTYLSKSFVTDWQGLEKLPNIKWAPLPPTSLANCLPDRACFTRQGTVTIAGKNLVVIATGARTIVSNVYFRNAAAPLGEAAIVAALARAGMTPELARCPLEGGRGGTNWYRLNATDMTSGHLAIQTSCNGRPCEGFVLSQGEQLPPLQPNQLALYSEQCAAGAERRPVSTSKPHELLAQTIIALVPSAAGSTLLDWNALTGLSTGITWNPGGPKAADLSFRNDPNPMTQSGQVTHAGRQFSVLVSGTQKEIKNIYFDEAGIHPRGEHLLGVIYKEGLTVQLVRCGPVYTESTNNWYRLTSAKTRPVMLKQSIRYDGNQVQDSYELRLDGTLPARDARDRDPGVNGCR